MSKYVDCVALEDDKVCSHMQISKKKKGYGRELRDNVYYWLLSLPAVLYFFIFCYLPMFGVVIAFKNYNYSDGILGSEWVGFRNFKFFFTSQDALVITRNTVCYGIAFMITGIITSVLVALLLFEIKEKLAIKMYQTIIILPNFLSWVIVSYITYILLDPRLGVLNHLFEALKITPLQWYTEPKYWPAILTVVNVWKNVGMSAIVYYAALMGIDSELYEAAKIDGARRIHQTWYISIPLLMPLMTILSVLSLGSILRGDFGLFYQIPRNVGTLYPTTDIIDTYVYRGLATGDLSATTAIGLFQSVAGLILVLLSNWIVKKIEPENSLF